MTTNCHEVANKEGYLSAITVRNISQSFTIQDTIRYDTRCYFNVRSKANMSQLNLPHGNRQLKSVKTEN